MVNGKAVLVILATGAYRKWAEVTARSACEGCSLPIEVKILDWAEIERAGVSRAKLEGLGSWHGSAITYAKMYMTELFPQVDRVIVCDADVLFRGDLAKLWKLGEEQFDGNVWLLPSRDSQPPWHTWNPYDAAWFAAHGLTIRCPENYFCAGFMLMDLKAMREGGWPRLRDEFLARYDMRTIPFGEQGVMNYLLQDHLRILPRQWGCFSGDANDDVDYNGDCAIHYVGDAPWERKGLTRLLSDAVVLWRKAAGMSTGGWRRWLWCALRATAPFWRWEPHFAWHFRTALKRQDCRKKRKGPGHVAVWLGVVAAWLLLASFDWCGQRQLFFRNGDELLSDFWMPRTCADVGYRVAEDETLPTFAGVAQSGWVEGEMRVAQHDRCYPATAIVPMKLFPRTWCGAGAWTVCVAVAFVAALCWIAQSRWPLLLLGAMPVVFNLERGNPIGIAAACVGLFLAGYRSPRKGVRIVAAMALSFAACLKISPVVLGGLYLREKDWTGIGWCVVFCAALFFIPWFFVPEGFAALPAMAENAQANFMEYARAAEFGLVDLWRAVRVALHQDCMHLWPGCLAVTRLSQVLGFAALAYSVWKRRPLLAVVGMLWMAGNMHYYGALYILPLFVMEMQAAKFKMPLVRLALWFVVLCPLQLVVLGHSANAVFCNLAAAALALTEKESA